MLGDVGCGVVEVWWRCGLVGVMGVVLWCGVMRRSVVWCRVLLSQCDVDRSGNEEMLGRRPERRYMGVRGEEEGVVGITEDESRTQ